MLSTVVGLASDAVPNVKFNVAKTLMRIGQWLAQPTIQQQVKPLLEKLKQDTDSDVQYFAAEAMDSEYTIHSIKFIVASTMAVHRAYPLGVDIGGGWSEQI